jgi:hypothetical protein
MPADCARKVKSLILSLITVSSKHVEEGVFRTSQPREEKNVAQVVLWNKKIPGSLVCKSIQSHTLNGDRSNTRPKWITITIDSFNGSKGGIAKAVQHRRPVVRRSYRLCRRHLASESLQRQSSFFWTLLWYLCRKIPSR